MLVVYIYNILEGLCQQRWLAGSRVPGWMGGILTLLGCTIDAGLVVIYGDGSKMWLQNMMQLISGVQLK